MSLLNNGKYTVSYPSSSNYLNQVESITAKIAKSLQFDESAIDDLSISITELFNNAIHHGNKNDISKDVVITYMQDPSFLVISIKDQGSGFEPEALRDPLAPENLLAENGRGIYLVKNLVDDVKFRISENGTEVLIYKKLPSQ